MIISERKEYQQKTATLQFEESTMVSEAVIAMSKKNYGASAVVDASGKLTGIFTERDLMNRVVAKGLDPQTVPLSQVMTSDLRVAKPDDDLREWLRIMSNERFRHLPVVDEERGRVVMMSQGDFVSYTWPELMSRISEQTRVSLGAKYYPFLIIAGLILYLIMLAVFN
jgi:CBS domain-containing protein